MIARRALATWAVPAIEHIPLPTHETYENGIDWIAVERATLGDRVDLTWDEKKEVALALVRAGFTEKETAARAGTSPRQVSRWKFDAGLGGANTCSRDDCTDKVKGRGLCDNHYRQDARERAAKSQDTRSRPRKKREPAKCGTRGGYKKHSRDKTEICGPCSAANSAYAAEYYRNTFKAAA